MKPIKVIKDGKFKDQYVFKGDVIEVNKENFALIDALNVGGFIEPLTTKEFLEIKKMVNKPIYKKEEE